MLCYLMLPYFNVTLVVVAPFNMALFDVALFNDTLFIVAPFNVAIF